MDVERLEQDVREGLIDVERLVELVAVLQRQLGESNKQLEEALRQLEQARKRIEELEKKCGGPTPKIAEPFSMNAEAKRQAARGKKKPKRNKPRRRGRISTADKVAQAARTEKVFPQGVSEEACWLSHTRPVWRLENGQAVLVAYEIYRHKNRYGQIPGTLGRSEFGLEIVVAIAYQVYLVGLSFDKVCLLFDFFQNLRLRKSQVDALLNQLARLWEGEFDLLCTLLAHSAVVHADETSWSLNSVWAFLSEKARLLFVGVHKDAETLKQILDPATFAGIMISDDAAVYANFTQAQKCWAHLLRKAIKLTLQAPENLEYRAFTDRLLEIYHKACRVQGDGRLGDAGRAQKVVELDDSIFDLCGTLWGAELPPTSGLENDYRLLTNELMRLMLAGQLFTFVTAPAVAAPNGRCEPVAGTNNEAERTLRGAAMARKTGRTSKTLVGARRQTILSSVLESLRKQLPTFTLRSVVSEIMGWSEAGRSCFAKLARKLKLKPPEHSPLKTLFPVPTD